MHKKKIDYFHLFLEEITKKAIDLKSICQLPG